MQTTTPRYISSFISLNHTLPPCLLHLKALGIRIQTENDEKFVTEFVPFCPKPLKDTDDKAKSKLPMQYIKMWPCVSQCFFALLTPITHSSRMAFCVWHSQGQQQQYDRKVLKVLQQPNWLLNETLWHPDGQWQDQSFDVWGMGW